MTSLRGETLFRRGNPVCLSRFIFWQVDRHRLRLRDDEGALAVRDDKQSDAAIYLLACREEKPFKRAVFKALKGFVRVMFGL